MIIVVGRVGKPHGLRGEVTVQPRTDAPEQRFTADATFATDPAQRGPLTIESVRFHQNTPLVAFAGVVDRNGAEALRGTLLLIDSDTDDLEVEEDEFWDHELIGLQALSPDGTTLGEVADVIHLPAQDLLAVTSVDGREVLVPFVSEIVTEVSRERRCVVIADPGGLFDESQAYIAGTRDDSAAAQTTTSAPAAGSVTDSSSAADSAAAPAFDSKEHGEGPVL